MRTIPKLLVVALAVIFTCSCSSTEEKMKKAIVAYQKEGYTILSQSENPSEANHFVLVQKNNQIFIDELSGKKSKRLVFPKEEGYCIKQIQLSMKDSVPTCSYILLDEGNKVQVSNKDYIVIQNEKLKGKQTLVFANKNAINAPYYVYCLSNPDTLFALGKWKELWLEENNIILKYCESLDKLFGENYKNNTFDVVMYLSIEDMSFKGFYGGFSLNANYDLDYIRSKYPGKEFKDQNNEVCFPLSWFGSPEIKTIKSAIDNYESPADRIKREMDSVIKEGKRKTERLNRQQNNRNSNKGNRIQWHPCSYCWGKGYTEGFNVSGRRTNYRCSHCGGQGGHWE